MSKAKSAGPSIDRRMAMRITAATAATGGLISASPAAAGEFQATKRHDYRCVPLAAKLDKVTFSDVPVDFLYALGDVIYDVASTSGKMAGGDREEFKKKKGEYLKTRIKDIGCFTDNLKIDILEDDPKTWNIVIPKEVDENKGKTRDYLIELGFVTIMGCK